MSETNGHTNGNGHKPKKGRPKGKGRKLTPKQEAFTENYLANGFNGTQAAKDAGYSGSEDTLAHVAAENLRKPQIASRVRERLDGLAANADEVLNLLADHMRADLADFDGCFDEDGRLDLVEAKKRGVSRLVKKLKSTTRSIPQSQDKPPIRETTVEIELYSAQDAAAKLIPVLGLKQKPGENEKDVERRRTWARDQLQTVMQRLGIEREAAIEWMRTHTPTAAQWIN